MSTTSDPVSIFYEDPTFGNLLEAIPSLFTRTLFAVFRVVTKVFWVVINAFRLGLILTLFVAIHVIAVIDALLVLLVAFTLVLGTLAAEYPPLGNLMDKYG